VKYQLQHVEWHSTPGRSQLLQVSMRLLDRHLNSVIEDTVKPLYGTISCWVVERGTKVTHIPFFQKSRLKLNTVIIKG